MADPELVNVLTSLIDSFKEGIKTEMNSFKEEIKTEINSFKEEIKAEMNSFKEEIRAEIQTINTRLDSLEERVTNLEKTCALIQEEHGKKLDLILDYIAGNIEMTEQMNNHFNHIDRVLADHSVRLAVIESTHVYQSALKNNNLDSKAAL